MPYKIEGGKRGSIDLEIGYKLEISLAACKPIISSFSFWVLIKWTPSMVSCVVEPFFSKIGYPSKVSSGWGALGHPKYVPLASCFIPHAPCLVAQFNCSPIDVCINISTQFAFFYGSLPSFSTSPVGVCTVYKFCKFLPLVLPCHHPPPETAVDFLWHSMRVAL